MLKPGHRSVDPPVPTDFGLMPSRPPADYAPTSGPPSAREKLRERFRDAWDVLRGRAYIEFYDGRVSRNGQPSRR